MKIISFFSGAGGFDLGFKKEGFKVIWANEFDKTIWNTYRLNHPETKLETKSISKVKLEDLPKDADGIIGGPPCQSWSLAGSMKGIEDERGKLFYEYIRLLKGYKPKFFIIENVKGMLSKTHKKQFENILSLLEEVGYKCNYELLNSGDYEVPQTRERVFIVGIREDLYTKPFIFPKKATKKILLKDVLKDIPKPIKYDKNQMDKEFNNEYAEGSFSSMFMSRNRIRDYEQQSFTIQASSRHAPLHPSSPKMIKVEKDKYEFSEDIKKVRRMSVRECARIQTFPDTFIFNYNNVNEGYKMIGNAVPVNLAKVIAKSIKEYLKK